jgi:hypothetical protein
LVVLEEWMKEKWVEEWWKEWVNEGLRWAFVRRGRLGE